MSIKGYLTLITVSMPLYDVTMKEVFTLKRDAQVHVISLLTDVQSFSIPPCLIHRQRHVSHAVRAGYVHSLAATHTPCLLDGPY